MSKNNTRRRKIKKLINNLHMDLYPHQRETLKALLKSKMHLVAGGSLPGQATTLKAARDLGIVVKPLLINQFAEFKALKSLPLSDVDYGDLELVLNVANDELLKTGPTERDRYGAPIWPDWVILKHGRHPMAGEYGKLCYLTACQRPNAVWWNRGSYHYYCARCAHLLNRENRQSWRELQRQYPPEMMPEGEMCIKLGPDDEHPVPH